MKGKVKQIEIAFIEEQNITIIKSAYGNFFLNIEFSHESRTIEMIACPPFYTSYYFFLVIILLVFREWSHGKLLWSNFSVTQLIPSGKLLAAMLAKDQFIMREESWGQWVGSKPALIAQSQEDHPGKSLVNFGSWEEYILRSYLSLPPSIILALVDVTACWGLKTIPIL